MSLSFFQAGIATARSHEIAADNRRKRLLRFLDNVAYGEDFTLKLGHRRISYSHMATEALEVLAEDVARDFWWRKKIRRMGKAAVAAKLAGVRQ